MSPDTTYTYPRGWFVIRFSDELGPGDVQPMRYFGKDLVLFRTEDGDPKVLDAFCPHLGAHLGHGGKVEGDSIKCPFHAWKFNGAGECTDIPYATKTPPKAKMECYTLCERNGIIYMWHDEEGNAPNWDVPEIEGYGDGEWLEWNHSCMEIKTQPREVIENVADKAHFMPVHGTDIRTFKNVFDHHIATQLIEATAYPLGGGTDEFRGDATYFGPAYMVSKMWGLLESVIINAHVPIDETAIDLRFAVSLRIQKGDRDRTAQFAKGYIDNLRQGFLQDVQIWENKVWRDRPVLCDGDGPIGRARKWYRQFYRPLAEAPTERIETSS